MGKSTEPLKTRQYVTAETLTDYRTFFTKLHDVEPVGKRDGHQFRNYIL